MIKQSKTFCIFTNIKQAIENNNSKKIYYMRKTLFTITASLLGLASASAQDVYIYKAGDPNALCGVTNVQRIEFNENDLTFFQKNDSGSFGFDLASVDYLLFYKKEIVNSIRNASNSKEINISYDGKNVSVESSNALSSVEVYTTDGVKYVALSPKSKNAKLSTVSYPAGVYIVKAVAGKEVTTTEIVKK